MDTGCLEIVVKRANNPLKKVMQIVAAALAAVCVLGLFVFGVFSLIGAVLFAALAWYLSQDLNIDYEYAYVDRELRVAKIINKSRRKEVAVYDLNEMEVMAPEKSHHLDSYNNRNLPVTDYSSHMEPARPRGGDLQEPAYLYAPQDLPGLNVPSRGISGCKPDLERST